MMVFKNFEIPNWSLQIETIISDLDKHDITHAETGLVKAIDFECADFQDETALPLKGQTLADYIYFIDRGKCC